MAYRHLGRLCVRKYSSGVPSKPTWSVNDLLSSYPQPTLPASTLNHLHRVSALIPPEEGSEEFESLRKDMEEMVRLVEAVKLVDTSGVKLDGGRDDLNMVDLTVPGRQTAEHEEEYLHPLAQNAGRLVDGQYVVHTAKPQKS